MMKKILQVVSVIALLLILMVVVMIHKKTINENEQINKICSTKDLSLISEIIYQLGDYTKDSELVNNIEENSKWSFEEVYFDDGDRTIYFVNILDEYIVKFGFGGKSPFFSKQYKQEYIEVEIQKNHQIKYWNKTRKKKFYTDNITTTQLDDSDEYTIIANEQLEHFLDTYLKNVNNIYCT